MNPCDNPRVRMHGEYLERAREVAPWNVAALEREHRRLVESERKRKAKKSR